jgi:hypothetical protein
MRKYITSNRTSKFCNIDYKQPPTQQLFDKLLSNSALLLENVNNNDLVVEKEVEEKSIIADKNNNMLLLETQYDNNIIVGDESSTMNNHNIDEEDKSGLYWKESDDEENEIEEKDFAFSEKTSDHLFDTEPLDDYIAKFRDDANDFANGKYENNNDDGDELFERLPPDNNTKRLKFHKKSEFCKTFYAVSIKHNLSESAMWEILNVFDTFTEFLNLPLKQKEMKKNKIQQQEDKEAIMEEEDRTFPRTSIDIEKYIEIDKSTLAIDICYKGCCAFLGNNAGMVKCPHCNEPRFSQCSQTSCKGKKYEQCKHKLSSRCPLRSMYYRSIMYVLTYKFIKEIKKKKFLFIISGKKYVQYQKIKKLFSHHRYNIY